MSAKPVVSCEKQIEPGLAQAVMAQFNQPKKISFELFLAGHQKVRVYLHPDGKMVAYNGNHELLESLALCLQQNHGRQACCGQKVWAYVGEIVIPNYAQVYPLPYRADNYVYLPNPEEGQPDNRVGRLIEVEVIAVYGNGLLSLQSGIY